MHKRIFILWILMLSALTGTAQTMQGYEYWFDNNYTGRTTAVSSQSEISLNIDIGTIPSGMHYLNFRAQGSDGKWGGLSRYIVYLGTNATQYEYWMDNDYANRTVVNGSVPSILSIDVSKISAGMHYLNFRARNGGGRWGGLSRYIVYVENNLSNKLSHIEYWIDDQTEVQTQQVNENTVLLSVDISALENGTHKLKYQGVTQRGGYCMLDSIEFEKTITPVAEKPIITHNGNTVKISVDTASVVGSLPDVYYTIDGSTPNATDGTKYIEPFEVVRNGVVKAISVKEGSEDSEVESLIVDWFKVEPVQFTPDGYLLSLSTPTKDAVIYYTNSNGDSQVTKYTEPLTLTEDCTIEAYATRDGYEDSDKAQYHFVVADVTVAAPVIEHSDNIISISSATPQAVIYYTTDGTIPTSESTPYTEPFEVTRNCTVQAIALRDNYYQSTVSSLVVDWFKVEPVQFTPDGYLLSLSTPTKDAVIYYTNSNGDSQVTKYTEPLTLTEDCTIEAYATRDGYEDSDKAQYHFVVADVTVAAPVIEHSDNIISISSATPQAVIYYTTDGTIPTSESTPYTEPFEVTRNCTVQAIALRDNYYQSTVSSLVVDWFQVGLVTVNYDGRYFTLTAEEGTQLTYSIDGSLPETYTSRVELDGLCTIKVTAERDGWEPYETIYEVNSFFDGVTAQVRYSGTLTKALEWCGGAAGADHIAAIIWNANRGITNAEFSGINNPNLLLYVTDKNYAPSTVRNVIVNGTAEQIILEDVSTGNSNFYCPIEFTAMGISYTHEYKMQTVRDVSQGWETITLPFTVQAINHETKGPLSPFGGDGGGKHFWLAELASNGLVSADKIEAYVPYIISMPNNPKLYMPEYNIAGKVTFSSTNVTVAVTNPIMKEGAGITFVPSFQNVDKSPSVFAINKNEVYNGYMEGSIFVSDYREVRPFEAYTLHADASRSIIALSELFTDIETGIGIIENDCDDVKVYNLSGLLVASGKRDDVMKHLPKGVYIINGKKVVAK